MDRTLADADYLVGNRFSVTDIIAGYTVNWARQAELLKPFPHLEAYLARLFQRPLCTYTKD